MRFQALSWNGFWIMKLCFRAHAINSPIVCRLRCGIRSWGLHSMRFIVLGEDVGRCLHPRGWLFRDANARILTLNRVVVVRYQRRTLSVGSTEHACLPRDGGLTGLIPGLAQGTIPSMAVYQAHSSFTPCFTRGLSHFSHTSVGVLPACLLSLPLRLLRHHNLSGLSVSFDPRAY